MPALPEVPELPSFPVPKVELPDLPPPPKLPDFFGEVSGNLDVISQFLEIYCLVRQLLLPIDEAELKETIERYTARSAKMIPSLDFMATVPYPELELAFIDEIKVTVKASFQLRFGLVLNILKENSEQWNELISDLLDEANKKLEESISEFEEYLDQSDLIPAEFQAALEELEQTIKEVNTQIQSEIDQAGSDFEASVEKLDELIQEAEEKMQKTVDDATSGIHEIEGSYGLDSETKDDIKDLRQEYEENLSDLQSNHQAAWQKSLLAVAKDLQNSKERIQAKITDNNSYQDVSSLRKSLKIPAPKYPFSPEIPETIRQLQQIKQELQDYKNKQESLVPAVHELALELQQNPHQKCIAADKNGQIKTNESHLLASTSNSCYDSALQNPKTLPKPQLIENQAQNKKTLAFSPSASVHSKLLAQSYESSNNNTSDSALNQTNESTINPCGLFILDKATQVSHRLIKDPDSCQSDSQLLIADIDNDQDEDVIYSLQSSLYLKKSSQNTSNTPESFYKGSVIQAPLNHFLSPYPIISDLSANSESDTEINVSWTEDFSHEDTIGVHFIFAPSVDAYRKDNLVLSKPLHLILLQESYLQNIDPDKLGTILNGPLSININNQEFQLEESESILLDYWAGNNYRFAVKNAFYHAKAQFLNKDFSATPFGNTPLFAPQKTSDNEAPIALNRPHKFIPVFHSLTINSNDFFDESNSQFAIDQNKDGVPEAFREQVEIGPFQEIGDKKYKFTIVDENLNAGDYNLDLSVYAPSPSLEYQNELFSGTLSPRIPKSLFLFLENVLISGNSSKTLISRNPVITTVTREETLAGLNSALIKELL